MTIPDVILVSGPTASGKSDFAVALASYLNGEIINVDSVQFYQDFNIGSAKPDISQLNKVPHHLFSIISPNEHLDVAIVIKLVTSKVVDIIERGKLPILVGSSGMYISALFSGLSEFPPKNIKLREELELLDIKFLYAMLVELDPERAEQLKVNDKFRIIRAIEVAKTTCTTFNQITKFSVLKPLLKGLAIILWPDRKTLYDKINLRSLSMIERGLCDETDYIINKYGRDLILLKSVGYREALSFLNKEINHKELIEQVAISTRRYAKRQTTYWRNEPFKKNWNFTKCLISDILDFNILNNYQSYFTERLNGIYLRIH
jgi:tRNA dimethylallyltransferase